MPPQMIPRRIYLIRHGLVVPESRNRFNGSTEAALDPYGEVQLSRVADYLRSAPPAALFASPLARTRQSAGVFSRAFDLEMAIEPDIREMHFGLFEGLSFQEIAERYPEEMDEFYKGAGVYRIPEAETMAEVQARAWPAVKKIAATVAEGQAAAVVAHGAVNRLVLAKVMDLDLNRVLSLAQNYACLNILDFYEDRTVVKGVNILPGAQFPTEQFDMT